MNNGGVFGTANRTVNALSGSPTLLVMVVLNCMFIAAAAFYLKNQQDNAFRLVGVMFDRCMPGHQGTPP